MKQRKLKPYIRLYKSGDKCLSFMTAIKLDLLCEVGKPFYVMVQHGVRGKVMDCACEKRALKQTIMVVRWKELSFNEWAKAIKRSAVGGYHLRPDLLGY